MSARGHVDFPKRSKEELSNAILGKHWKTDIETENVTTP